MLEAAVAAAFITAAVILLILAFTASDRDGINHPRPSDDNWRHW